MEIPINIDNIVYYPKERKPRCRNKNYRWHIIIYYKELNKFKDYKYTTIKEMNDDLGLNLSADLAWRLSSGKKYKDSTGSRSMNEKYGHIKLTKINELIK